MARPAAQTAAPMRLGLLHYTYAPVIGGVERVMADHARLLREQGHEVTIFCGEAAPAPSVEIIPELRRADGGEPAAEEARLLECCGRASPRTTPSFSTMSARCRFIRR